MKVWIFNVGEPLPFPQNKTRLRRMGNFALYASALGIDIHLFSVSFDHYQKVQRTTEERANYAINDHFQLSVVKVTGYQKNVSLARIVYHREAAKKFVKAIKEEEERPDIVVLGSTPLEVVCAVAECLREWQIPYVIDIRDLWPAIFSEAVPKLVKPIGELYCWCAEKKVRRAYQGASGLVALSQGFLNYGLSLASREQSVQDKVVRMGYPEYAKLQDNQTVFQAYWGPWGLKTEDFIVAFTGNFGRQFDFRPIIQAAQKLIHNKRIKFVLCGEGENLERIKQEAPKNISFPGWVEQIGVFSLLQAASLGIAPYRNSMNFRLNMPTKFGEYLYFSLPILTAVQGEMKDFVTAHQCGCYYQNSTELARAIEAYVADFDQLEQEREAAKKAYQLFFNGEKTNEQLLEGLKEIINLEASVINKKEQE
ncbi:glycosyltransferase family 4 protein [Enterococcus ureasiticus]|uniref:Glycosyltransferase WbuB n=1 Tax=Enterococcus ureasiticus TaxID=903984 RepID=A0A1E5GHA0_9ENTE|nr:glycosyltransferase family 4 protein [Enterococcus ureasiticus]OEG11965.1 hypothetical protein BCR21_06940 [Enterococcus ureasiticus]